MDQKLLAEISEYIEDHYLYSQKRMAQSSNLKLRVAKKVACSDENTSQLIDEEIDPLLSQIDDSFAKCLWKHVQNKGLSDVEVYKRANLDRRLFSKIRNDKTYKPSKNTAMALVIGLELNMDEADDFLKQAGFALANCNKEDVVIKYFIEHQKYDIFLINEVLEHYYLPILGERKTKNSKLEDN